MIPILLGSFCPQAHADEDLKKIDDGIRAKLESHYPAPDLCKNTSSNSWEKDRCESVRLKIQNLDQRMAPKAWTEEYAWQQIEPHPFPKNGCDVVKDSAVDCAQKILQQDFRDITSDLFFGVDCSEYKFDEIKSFVQQLTDSCKKEKTFLSYYTCLADTGKTELSKNSSFKPFTKRYIGTKLESLRRISQELEITTQYCKKNNPSALYLDCGSGFLVKAVELRSTDSLLSSKVDLTKPRKGLARNDISVFSENQWFCKPDVKKDLVKKKSENDQAPCDPKTQEVLDLAKQNDLKNVMRATQTYAMHIDASENVPEVPKKDPSIDSTEDETPLAGDQISEAIKKAFDEKLKNKTLTEAQKKKLQDLVQNKKYLDQLQKHYDKMENGTVGTAKQKLDEIKKNLDLALNQTLNPVKKDDKKADEKKEEPEFTLDDETIAAIGKEKENPSEQLKAEEKLSEEKKEEAAKKQANAEKDKKDLLDKVKKEFANKTDIPKVEPKKEDVPKTPELTKADQDKVNASSIHSKSTLIGEAQDALKDFKDGKTPNLEYSDFFLETEAVEKKEKESVNTTDEDFKLLYGSFLKDKEKYKEIIKNNEGSNTDKIMAVMKELNREYVFDYTLPYAHMLEMLDKKGGNCLAETKFITAVMKDLGLKPDSNQVYTVQVFDNHIQPALYDKSKNEVTFLVDGSKQQGLIAPVFKPEVILHQYLITQGKSSPTKYEDFMVADIPQELKEKALAAAKKAKESGIAGLMEKQMKTNTDLNFPKTGIYFSQGDGFSAPPMKANIGWDQGNYRENASDFYSGAIGQMDRAQWEAMAGKIQKYEPPSIDYAKAQNDMREVLRSSNFNEYLRLKKDPTLIANGNINESKIKDLKETENRIYSILEGKDYVSGKNASDGTSQLRQKLGQDNPELQALYGQLKSEREPLAKTGVEGDQVKGKYFELFKALGPKNWALYKTLQTPTGGEGYLTEGIGKPNLALVSAQDLDGYFTDQEKVSFETQYKKDSTTNKSGEPVLLGKAAEATHKTEPNQIDNQDPDPSKKPIPNKQVLADAKKKQTSINGAASDKKSKGQGTDPNGIAYKPEKKGVNKLTPKEFAQFIEQSNLTGSSIDNSRWSPTLTAALRDKKEYSKDLVEWFESKGYRSIADSRTKDTQLISGPDKKPIPKDIAVLLVDFLRGKDGTGADGSALAAQINKNYGSVSKYLEQVKEDFGKEKPKEVAKKDDNDNDTIEVFKKIAKDKGFDVSFIEKANAQSFKYKTRDPETFMMGSPESEKGRFGTRETQHQVQLTKSYNIALTPVTQLQWYLVMGANPSNFKNNDSDGDHITLNGTDINSNHPVETVSWEDAQVFIAKLNSLDGRCTYRLPTDAEWEAAARAKTTTAYSFGNEEADLASHGWYEKNSDNRTHAVGQKTANPEGLYDMHGNVWQWTAYWYTDSPSGGVNPSGPSSGSYREIRGGGWDGIAQVLRSASRGGNSPSYRSENVGLRLARTCP